MTGHALLGRGLVKQNGFCASRFRQLVAVDAADVLVGATQRESSSLVMVEQRWLPLHAVVAFGATRGLARSKLLSVDILMAIFALRRGRLEIYVDQLRFKIARLVAINAGRGAVRSQQREIGLGVIEAREFFP